MKSDQELYTTATQAITGAWDRIKETLGPHIFKIWLATIITAVIMAALK